MLKIFFATFFIAELIIATAVISKIYKLDKCVNNWNNIILANQDNIRIGLVDIRLWLEEFSQKILELKDFIKRKREEYFIKTLKTSLIYSSFFLLRGKYQKTILAYQVIKEIYEGFIEAEE